MGGFFNLDGPFARFGNMLADVIILSLVWLVFSIPVVTAGASTTALYYVTTRRISDREGYLLRDFWNSFRSNFIQATASWLIMLLLAAVLFINIYNIDLLGNAKTVILPLQLCIAFELCVVSLYVFPLISRFELTLLGVFKNAFFMANRHLPTTLLLLLLGVGAIVLSLLTILFSLVAMGAYAYVASHLIMRIFRKYRPDMDRDADLV